MGCPDKDSPVAPERRSASGAEASTTAGVRQSVLRTAVQAVAFGSRRRAPPPSPWRQLSHYVIEFVNTELCSRSRVRPWPPVRDGPARMAQGLVFGNGRIKHLGPWLQVAQDAFPTGCKPFGLGTRAPHRPVRPTFVVFRQAAASDTLRRSHEGPGMHMPRLSSGGSHWCCGRRLTRSSVNISLTISDKQLISRKPVRRHLEEPGADPIRPGAVGRLAARKENAGPIRKPSRTLGLR